MKNVICRVAIIFALAFAGIIPAQADDASVEAATKAAWEKASQTAIHGPSRVSFKDDAHLDLPEGIVFVPQAEASVIMKLWGNEVDERFKGFLLSEKDGENWTITVEQNREGYVRDEEAASWNPDDLLQSLKDGTESQNEQREKIGMAPLDVVGWVESPRYDASKHHLVWSLKAVERGAPADADATVNYNTYVLGRDGYFEIRLLTDAAHVEKDKPFAQIALNAFHYDAGKRYEDFVVGTDHLAEYGIAALVGGIAAKKLGLLALIGVFVAKFAKLILLSVAVAGGAIAKFFRRRN